MNDFKCPPLALWASIAEEILKFSRLSRSAERSKRYFHGRGRGGKRHLQRRLLRKRGAALYDPTCEKRVQESPQTFLNPKIKNNFSAEDG